MAFLARSIRVGPRNSGGVTQTGFSFESSNLSLALNSFSTLSVLLLFSSSPTTVSALETGFAGFFETPFLKEFSAAGHDLTSLEGLYVYIQPTDETFVFEGL